MLHDLIIKNRSVRRFKNGSGIKEGVLTSLVDMARVTASAGNRQKLRYATVEDKVLTSKIRENLAFAAYLEGWGGPTDEENPDAYIVLFADDDKNSNLFIDVGIAAEAITLGAKEAGLGACMFRSFKTEKIKEILGTELIPLLVIALGVPGERVELTDAINGNIKYYRDENDTHVVPKLPLNEVLIIKK